MPFIPAARTRKTKKPPKSQVGRHFLAASAKLPVLADLSLITASSPCRKGRVSPTIKRHTRMNARHDFAAFAYRSEGRRRGRGEGTMFVIIGLVVVFGSILLGYTMHGGQVGVLIQITEFIIIGGAG